VITVASAANFNSSGVFVATVTNNRNPKWGNCENLQWSATHEVDNSVCQREKIIAAVATKKA